MIHGVGNYESVDGFGESIFFPGLPSIPAPLGVSGDSFESKDGLWFVKQESKPLINEIFKASIINAPSQLTDPTELTVQLDVSGKSGGGNMIVDGLIAAGAVVLLPKNPSEIAMGKIIITKTAATVRQLADSLNGIYGIYGGPPSVIAQASALNPAFVPIPVVIPGQPYVVPTLPPIVPLPTFPGVPQPAPPPAAAPPVVAAPAYPAWLIPATVGAVAVALGAIVLMSLNPKRGSHA